jgi:hypothetical protein
LLLIPFPAFALAIFALTLAFAPLHPKIGGLAWILFGLMGLVTYLRSGALTARNLAPSSEARNLTPVEQAACVWLLACLVSGILRIIPHSFWHDDWGRRHAEARLLLGALESAALVSSNQNYRLNFWRVLKEITLGGTLSNGKLLQKHIRWIRKSSFKSWANYEFI